MAAGTITNGMELPERCPENEEMPTNKTRNPNQIAGNTRL
jgi:hypothetical protein